MSHKNIINRKYHASQRYVKYIVATIILIDYNPLGGVSNDWYSSVYMLVHYHQFGKDFPDFARRL